MSSGIPSPPLSPPLSAYGSSKNSGGYNSASQGRRGLRRGGAAYTITGESERLFCETLRAVFLGEGNLACQDSLVTGVQNDQQLLQGHSDYGCDVRSSGSMTGYEDRIHGLPFPEVDGFVERRGLVTQWVEIWDYVGGARFRGFVAEKEDGERAMFVFFDDGVVRSDLKPGLMALLELCDIPFFSCSRLVVCLDRNTNATEMKALTRDLGWVGFGLTTLAEWTRGDEITSDSWIFMGMDV